MPDPLKRHLLALILLAAVGVPIFVLDWMLLGPTGGGWAAMDFRGLFIGLYGAYATLVWIISGLIAFTIRPRLVGCLGYAAVAVGTAVVVSAGAGLWYVLDDFESSRRWAAEDEALLEETQRIAADVSLTRWSIVEGEVSVFISSSRPYEICDWSLAGSVEYRQDVSTVWDEGPSCATDGPHTPIPTGISELRRELEIMDGGSIENIERWRIEVHVMGALGETTLTWQTAAAPEALPGSYDRPLPERE